jgi:hypothetical protein
MVTVLVAMPVVFVASIHPTDKHYNTFQAAIRAEECVWACRKYSRQPDAGGKYPARLADLLAPPFGGESMLEAWEKDSLIDPWGNPYKYALVPNADGTPEPYVWTEREAPHGRTTLIGAKLTAQGEVVAFGLPRDP